MSEIKDIDHDNLIPIDDKYIPVDEHIEYVSENGKRVGYKGIYLLPNLLTTAAMFGGFYAILSAIHQNFEAAVIAIFCAMFFDALDGRVARLVNAQSAFGVEYDSLSDMVSFGVAPAIVAFNFGLIHLGKIGWSIAFLYMVCASLRLARFNTQSGDTPSTFFSGLASPAAAAFLSSYIWLLDSTGVFLKRGDYLALGMLGLVCLAAGLLMVSNLSYYSFKKLNIKGRVSFVLLLALILVGLLIASDPPLFLFLLASCYVVSGIAYTFYQRLYHSEE